MSDFYTLLWCVGSFLFALAFTHSAWRDFQQADVGSDEDRGGARCCARRCRRARRCSFRNSARITINACAIVYNIALGIAEGYDNYVNMAGPERPPPLWMMVPVLLMRTMNCAVSIIVLHLYLHISACWTSSRRLVRVKWCCTALLVSCLLAWVLVDHGRTWYRDAWPTHPQWSSSTVVRSLMPVYYILIFLIELACVCILLYLQRHSRNQAPPVRDAEALPARGSSESLLSSLDELPVVSASPALVGQIKSVLRWNYLVLAATACMAVLQTRPFKGFLVRRDWYGGVFWVLYSLRYLALYMLAAPTAAPPVPTLSHDIDDALHCGTHDDGRWQRYRFRRGCGILILNLQYCEHSRYSALPGGDVDALERRLCAALAHLGFPSRAHRDLTGSRIREYFRAFVVQAAQDDVDGIVLAFLGHGEPGAVVGVDGERVHEQELVDAISDEPWLANRPKPKIFLLDRCRGAARESSTRSQVTWASRFPARLTGPRAPSLHADFLFCNATAEGFIAHVDGGRFVFSEALLDAVEDLDLDGGAVDIQELVGRVTSMVSGARIGRGVGFRQCPTTTSTLTRTFVLPSWMRATELRQRASSAPAQPTPPRPEGRVRRGTV